ncbi:hypothetical protein AURDEDRAFT_184804 [Auricularia subglabra TFB-10046 SS5]|nr:hypothetical protein AURDEDRAFT_184804 [Auricularia subglabra TFB-10046 SS5]
MADSGSPLKPAAVGGELDIDYVPILPETAVKHRKYKHVNLMKMPVPSGTRKILRPCDRWSRHVHPSGRVYMRHDGLRVVMEGNREIVCTLNGGLTRLAQLAGLAAKRLWEKVADAEANDYELFLHMDLSESPHLTASYYFVDWTGRSTFWVQATTVAPPAASLWHSDGVRELQFWTYVDYYPMHHALPPDSREELDAIMAYHTIGEGKISSPAALLICADAKTFNETTAPWKSEDTHLLAKSLPVPARRSFPRNPSRRSSMESDITATHAISAPAITAAEGSCNASTARLWRQIWLSRVQNFYGDSWARLARTERRCEVEQSQEPPQWLQNVLSFLLFNRPPRFYKELRDVFVDEIMYQIHWKAFVADDVHPEWTQNGMMGPLLASKVLSLSSTIFATATLFTAMRLIAFHVKLKSATAEEAMHHMHQCSMKPLGLFGVAMLFSIPFITFMWSMLTYIAAVLVFSFQHWSVDAGVPLITTTVVPVLAILVWMWWFFATSPQKGEDEGDEDAPASPPDNNHCGGGAVRLRFPWPVRRKSTGDSTCVADEDLEKGAERTEPHAMHC